MDHKSQSLLSCLPGQYKQGRSGTSESSSETQSILTGHAKILDAVSSSSRVLKDVQKGFPSKRQMALNNLKQLNADGTSQSAFSSSKSYVKHSSLASQTGKQEKHMRSAE